MPDALTFNSYEFVFVFLPIVMIGYWALRTTRYANYWLAAASLAFYATSGAIYLLPLLATCFIDFYVGRWLAAPISARRRKLLFAASVGVQIALLCAFKYLGWATQSLQAVAVAAGLGLSLPVMSLPLPPGISFYTFHTISYTADIYRGKFRPHNRIIDYITFVAFFPQLVAGPIARAANLLPEIAQVRESISWRRAETAVWLICWGLFKKIALADNFANLVSLSEAHIQPHTATAGAGLLFAYAFAGQIYCDFSAYTDIARGVAKLFNIELPRNFLTPYFALHPADFWRRWHISLSTWLRDYLYIPLGGDRGGKLKTLRNLVITMSLGGLWHGAGLGFIGWGLYHALLLVIYRVTRLDAYLDAKPVGSMGKVLAVLVTLHLVCFGWIFFRAAPDEILPAFRSICGLSAVTDWPFTAMLLWGLALYATPLVVTEVLGRMRGAEFVDLYENWHWAIKAIVYVAIFYAVVLFGARERNAFIYFQF